MFNTAEFICNLFFIIYFLLKVRSGLLSPAKINAKLQLLVIIVCSLGFTLTLYFKKELGKSLFGTCSVDAISNLPMLGPLLLLLFILLAAVSICYFKKKIPVVKRTREMKAQFISQFYSYLKCVSAVWSIAAFFNFLAVCVCTFGWNTQYFTWTISIYNISKTMTPFVLTYIRLKNPFIAKKLASGITRLKRRWSKQYRRITEPLMSSINSVGS